MSLFLCTLNCKKHGNTLLFRLLRQIGKIDLTRDPMQTQTDPAPICFKRQRQEPAFFKLIHSDSASEEAVREGSNDTRCTPSSCVIPLRPNKLFYLNFATLSE